MAARVEMAMLPPGSSETHPTAIVCLELRPSVLLPREPRGTQAGVRHAAARPTATPLAAQQAGARDLLASLAPEERRAGQR
jgi:hypothetical protein